MTIDGLFFVNGKAIRVEGLHAAATLCPLPYAIPSELRVWRVAPANRALARCS